jgi:hypothetical protein|tara:strand:- start:1362 stop:1664 length:303 start_codon:yes stop_codon:yes gene_type:complete
MEQINKEEGEKKSFLKKVKDHDVEILATFVRLGVVVWSGFIITLNYVDLPMIKKGQSGGDITFVASVFTGALATFGLNTSNSKNGKPTNCPMQQKKKEEC